MADGTSAYKSLSVIITDQDLDHGTLQSAIVMARRMDAHLDVICLAIDFTALETFPAGAVGLAAMPIHNDESYADATAMVAWAKQQMPAAFAKFEIRPIVASQFALPTILARAVRYSELVVVNRPYGGGRTAMHVTVLETALFACELPVLVVSDTDHIDIGRVVIAWDETDGAMTAVRQAMPILQAADRVEVVMVDPPSHSAERSDPGGALCVMLARRGIKPEVAILAGSMPRVSDVLLRYASEHNTDLIVMGGYGHSRLREAMFGGVTRDMLEKSPLPLMMAR